MASSARAAARAATANLTATQKLGQDFFEVYTSGTLILRQPIEASTIYLITVILASSIEYLFEMAGRVNSKFFRQLFKTQVEETFVFGTLILLLVIFSSFVADMPEGWAVVFAWVEMSIVFMAVWYCGLTSVVALKTAQFAKELETFETSRMGSGDQGDLKDYEKLFTNACTRFKMSMLAFGYDKPLVHAKYLFRVQKRIICGLADLNWKVWLSMTVPTVFNAVRAGLMDGAEQSGNATIAVFIFWQGGLPVLLFLWVYRKINSQVRVYLNKDIDEVAHRVKSLDANYADTAEGEVEPFTREELADPKQFLIQSSLSNTVSVVQICMIQITWYGAILLVTMYAKIMAQNGGVAFVLFVGSLVPPVIFVWLMPWTLTVISMLSSLETELDQTFVAASYARLEKDGLAKLLVVTNQAAEDENKKNEFSVNNSRAIQEALDAKLAEEAAKVRRAEMVDEWGRPMVKRLPSRPLNSKPFFTMKSRQPWQIKMTDDANKWFEQALKAADVSIAAKETYQNMVGKANVLLEMGRNAEGFSVADKAIARGKADKVDTTAFEKRIADLKAGKM